MEIISSCPICSNGNFKPFLSCVDHTLSHEIFSIVECAGCGFRFTNPRPAENEIKKYYQSEQYISHSNTRKGLVNFLYQKVRHITLKKKLKLIKSLTLNFKLQTLNILDIGCGTGEFLNTCKKAGYKTTGIEPSAQARKFAYETYGLDVQDQNKIKTLPGTNYDVITLWHVLEHVHNLQERVRELKRLLKPKGVIIVAVPNCSSYDAKHYKEFWAAYDVPRHLYHFRSEDIIKLFDDNNFIVKDILPMKFDSYYVSMLSEKYKTGSTNLLRSTWNGYKSNTKASRTGEGYSSQTYIITI